MAAAKTFEIVVRLRDEMTSHMKQMEKEVGGFKKQLASIASIAKTAFVGFAVYEVGKFFRGAVAAAQEEERALSHLTAVLQATGGVAGMTRQELVNLANEMQNTTVYSNDLVMSAESIMLTFTNVSRNVFPEAMKRAADMSAAFGQDLKSSIIQLGTALNDPIHGVGRLMRIGVSFTEQQKEMIKNFMEQGKVIEAQRVILDELAREFGGVAEKEAQTFWGRMKQIGNALSDLQKELGKVIMQSPQLRGGFEDVLNAVKQATSWMEKHNVVLQRVLNVVLALGTGLLKFLIIPFRVLIGSIKLSIQMFQDWKQYIHDIIEKLKAYGDVFAKIQKHDWKGAFESFKKASSDLVNTAKKDAGKIAKDYGKGLLDTMKAYWDPLKQLTKGVYDAYNNVADAADNAADAQSNMAQQNAVVSRAMASLKPQLKGVAEGFKDYIQTLQVDVPDTMQIVARATEELSQEIQGKLSIMMEYIGGIIDRVSSAIVESLNGAKVDWNQMLKDMLKALEEWAIKVGLIFAALQIGSAALGAPLNPGETFKLATQFAGVPGFAEGGYVTRPTLALVGEREPEYIIPQSKMQPTQVQVIIHEASPRTWVEVLSNLPQHEWDRIYREKILKAKES